MLHVSTTLTVAFVSESAASVLRIPDLHWRVHSVFRQALNLVSGERLVAVAPEAAGGLPNGIAISGQADFRGLRLVEGMPVASAWPIFEISPVGVTIDLRHAWSWSPRLPSGTIDVADPAIRERIEIAAAMVAARATRTGFGQWTAPDGSAIAVGLRSIEALRAAIAAADVAAALGAVEALVGLGDGLTPSGDDFLVGLGAALLAADHELAGPLARHAATQARKRTSDVARVALEHADRGEYAERIHDVLAALAREDDATVRHEVGRALSWGASSGTDMMLGVVVGLESVARRTPAP